MINFPPRNIANKFFFLQSFFLLCTLSFLSPFVSDSYAADTTFLIDLGREDSPYVTTTTGWNNFYDPRAGSSSPLVDSTGAASSLTFQILNSFYYETTNCSVNFTFCSNSNGTTSSSLYPASASRDSFFLGTIAITDTSGAISIGGLNDAYTYDFRFYASRVAGDSGNRTTDYVISGTTVSLNATDNINGYVEILGKSPTSGEIIISVLKATAASFGYLGVLEITEHGSGNTPPTAAAGTDQSITLPTDTATLNGSSSTDSDGTIASYAWSFISGPSTPSITSATSASTGITALSTAGTYIFRLTVTDDGGATDTDDISVVVSAVSNQVPVAAAGTDQAITMPTNSVTLDGGGSTDSDGTIASYSWTETSSNYATITSPTASSTTITDLTSGTYTFRLTVTDDDGATDTDDISVVVSDHSVGACPAKKVVVLGSSTSAGYGISPSSDSWVNRFTTYFQSLNASNTVNNLAVGGYTTYHILATGSTPPGGRPSPDTTHNITHALSLSPDAIIVNMPSNDTANGYSVSEQQTNFETLESIASAANVPIWMTTTQPRNLGTTAKNELITMKDWINTTFGSFALDFWTLFAEVDGSVNPTYDQGDGIHLTAVAHKKLYARAAASNLIDYICNTPPTAAAGTDQSITLPTDTATLNGSSSTDSDGTIASYAWSFISGPSTPSITSATSASTGITALSTAGTYIFRLTVTDDGGATDTDDISVVVSAATISGGGGGGGGGSSGSSIVTTTVPEKPSVPVISSTARVTASLLNVRFSPGGALKTQVRRDEIVTILATSGSWSNIRMTNGTEGWVASTYLVADASPSSVGTTPFLDFFGDVTVVSKTLNVRKTPGGVFVRTILKGDKGLRLDTSGNWIKLRFSSGDEGWVWAPYTSVGSLVASTAKEVVNTKTVKIPSEKKYVRVISESAVIYDVPFGEQIAVVSSNTEGSLLGQLQNGFFKVLFGSTIVGYIRSENVESF